MKKFMYIVFLGLMANILFAQAPVDIFDPFYEDLIVWKNTGLINDAPDIRPYPLQEIKRILEIVIESGTPKQVKRATEYKNRFFETSFHFGTSATLGFAPPSKKYQLSLAPLGEMNIKLHDILTASAYFDASVVKLTPKNEILPKFQFSRKDLADDSAKVGSFKILPMINSSVTIGTPEYYFSAGIARTSFGPFSENNIIIGEQSFHSGQFIFVVNKEKFTYNQVFLTLASTNDEGKKDSANKFLAGHSITYRPLPWISVGLFDFITYGKRFEPIYFLPLSLFFVGQGIYDFPDNSMLGLTFSIKPVTGLKIDMVLLADDLGFNEIIKFKEAKWRMSGQFGISYTMPKDYWFVMADLNYTMVTPYCYTHVDNFDIEASNYKNYTHAGLPLGSNLPPNSDRINLKLKFEPLYGMNIDFYNTFIRHGNISESITDGEMLFDYLSKDYTTDGSVFNHATITEPHEDGSTRNKEHAFLYETPFLKQKTIQYVNQLGLDFKVNIPIIRSGGNIEASIGYVFEANINPNVGTNMFFAGKFDSSIIDTNSTAKYKKWEELTDVQKAHVQALADAQREQWRKQAVGKEFNHYFTIKFKFAY